jgi:hypothetical protein
LDSHDRQLLAASILCGTRGVLYCFGISQAKSFVLDRVDDAIPLQIYGVLWLGAAIWGITDALRHKQGRWSARVMSLLCTLWGFFYLISAVYVAPWQAVSAIFFFGLAWMIGEIPKNIATNAVVIR